MKVRPHRLSVSWKEWLRLLEFKWFEEWSQILFAESCFSSHSSFSASWALNTSHLFIYSLMKSTKVMLWSTISVPCTLPWCSLSHTCYLALQCSRWVHVQVLFSSPPANSSSSEDLIFSGLRRHRSRCSPHGPNFIKYLLAALHWWSQLRRTSAVRSCVQRWQRPWM